MTEHPRAGWLERHQGLVVAVASLVLAAVGGLGWLESRSQRLARDRDHAELTAALREQAKALDGQRAAMVERLRLDYLPAPRILSPEPFANRGGGAVISLAAQNAGGPAREARLTAVVLCCARLESLGFKPESALLVASESPETLPILAAGETLRHEIVLDAPDHPVRLTVRQGLEQSIWLWVALRYREPLALDAAEGGQEIQALSFVWDGARWSWATATADQHTAVEGILAARGLLPSG